MPGTMVKNKTFNLEDRTSKYWDKTFLEKSRSYLQKTKISVVKGRRC
jgi:hypothetical protein